MLRSDPKAAWQGDESCVLMYPVYLRADRSNVRAGQNSRDTQTCPMTLQLSPSAQHAEARERG
eukprot:COSAG06_NODE_56623_length_283_cov_12.304348_1_plen_62_part_01